MSAAVDAGFVVDHFAETVDALRRHHKVRQVELIKTIKDSAKGGGVQLRVDASLFSKVKYNKRHVPDQVYKHFAQVIAAEAARRHLTREQIIQTSSLSKDDASPLRVARGSSVADTEQFDWFRRDLKSADPLENFDRDGTELRRLADEICGPWLAIEYSKTPTKDGRRGQLFRSYFIQILEKPKTDCLPFLALGKHTKWQGACYLLRSANGKTLLYLISSVFERINPSNNTRRALRDEVAIGVFHPPGRAEVLMSGLTLSLAFGTGPARIGATRALMWKFRPRNDLSNEHLDTLRSAYCRYHTKENIKAFLNTIDPKGVLVLQLPMISNSVPRNAVPFCLLAEITPSGDLRDTNWRRSRRQAN